MLKRLLIIGCFLTLAATSLMSNVGCTRKTVIVEHDHRWH